MRHTIHNLLAVGILLCSGIARAADPPSNAIPLRINFKDSIGQVDYYKSDEIPDNSGQIINGIDFIKNGDLTVRNGTSIYFEIGNGNGNESSYENSWKRGRYFTVYVATNGFVYFIGVPGSGFISRPFINGVFEANQNLPSNGGAIDLGDEMDSLSIDGRLYIVGQSTGLFVFTSNPNTHTLDYIQPANTPIGGKYIRAHLDRLLIAGNNNTSLRNRIYFSSASLYTAFSTMNVLDVITDKNNEYITGMGQTLLGILPVYTNKSVKAMTGSEFPTDTSVGNIAVRNIADNIGCHSHRTIKNLDNKQYFFSLGQNSSEPGIYVFNGISVKEKTKAIRNFFLNEVNLTTAPINNAFVYKNKYCLVVSSKTTYPFVSASMAVCVNDTDKIEIYRDINVDYMDFYNNQALYVNSKSFQMGQKMLIYSWDYPLGYDDGELIDFGPGPIYFHRPIVWEYKTKDYDMGRENRFRAKMADRAYLKHDKSVSITTITVTANFDFGKSSATWKIDASTTYIQGNILTVNNSSGSVVNKLLFPKESRFNYVNFDFSGSSITSLNSFEFYAVPEVYR